MIVYSKNEHFLKESDRNLSRVGKNDILLNKETREIHLKDTKGETNEDQGFN